MDKSALREEAKRLGFSGLGFVSADAPLHVEFYRQWLDLGFAADMDYLKAHFALKDSARNLLPEARTVLVVSLDYNQQVTRSRGTPKIARYALGRDYHRVIRQKLKLLAKILQNAEPTSVSRACVDSAPLLERELGHLAGLGWFGKNTCLIDTKRGSWFFLGSLLTSVEFEPDLPAIGGCGSCTACIDQCPTGAIVSANGRWQVDSRRCISYLTIEHRGEFAPEDRLDGWTFGCDVCQEVCPFNTIRESQPNRGALASDRDLLAKRTWPNLTQLAQIAYQDWDKLTEGSPVRRAGHEGLRRNAVFNLRGIPNGPLSSQTNIEEIGS